MKDLLKTLFFGYWNDFDSRIAGYRVDIIFMWVIIIIGIIIPLVCIVHDMVVK